MWIAKAVIVAASIVMVVIRAPHGQRSRAAKVTTDRRGRLENVLLAMAMVGFVIPLIWVVSPLFAFADYPLRPGALASGIVFLVVGLWLFYRSHADLGANWSLTLQIREQHQLITTG